MARRDLTHKEMQKWIDKAAAEPVNDDEDQVYAYEDTVINKLEPIRNNPNAEPDKISNTSRRRANRVNVGNPVLLESHFSSHPLHDIEAPISTPRSAATSAPTGGRRPRRRTNSIDLGLETDVTMECSNHSSLPSPHSMALEPVIIAMNGSMTPRSKHSNVESITSYYQTHGRINITNNIYGDGGNSRIRSNSYELSQISHSSASVSLNGSHQDNDHHDRS